MDLTEIDSPVEPVLRMMAHLDSGAELDGVGGKLGTLPGIARKCDFPTRIASAGRVVR